MIARPALKVRTVAPSLSDDCWRPFPAIEAGSTRTTAASVRLGAGWPPVEDCPGGAAAGVAGRGAHASRAGTSITRRNSRIFQPPGLPNPGALLTLRVV